MPPAFPGPAIASSMARSTTKSSSSNSSSNNSASLSIASSMARSTTKSNSNSSNNNSNSNNNNNNNNNNNSNNNNNNKKKNNKNKNKNNSNSNKSSSSSGNSRKPTRTAAPGESSPRPFGCGVVVVVVVVFLGEVKARPKDIISFSLDYNKQKLSSDKQSIIKPHFTRHAGKAGGFLLGCMFELGASHRRFQSSTPRTRNGQLGWQRVLLLRFWGHIPYAIRSAIRTCMPTQTQAIKPTFSQIGHEFDGPREFIAKKKGVWDLAANGSFISIFPDFLRLCNG